MAQRQLDSLHAYSIIIIHYQCMHISYSLSWCIVIPGGPLKLASATGFIELLPSLKHPVKLGEERCLWLASYSKTCMKNVYLGHCTALKHSLLIIKWKQNSTINCIQKIIPRDFGGLEIQRSWFFKEKCQSRPCPILIPAWGSIWESSGFFRNQNKRGSSSG